MVHLRVSGRRSSSRVPPSLLPGMDTARTEATRSAADLLADLDEALSRSAR